MVSVIGILQIEVPLTLYGYLSVCAVTSELVTSSQESAVVLELRSRIQR